MGVQQHIEAVDGMDPALIDRIPHGTPQEHRLVPLCNIRTFFLPLKMYNDLSWRLARVLIGLLAATDRIGCAAPQISPGVERSREPIFTTDSGFSNFMNNEEVFELVSSKLIASKFNEKISDLILRREALEIILLQLYCRYMESTHLAEERLRNLEVMLENSMFGLFTLTNIEFVPDEIRSPARAIQAVVEFFGLAKIILTGVRNLSVENLNAYGSSRIVFMELTGMGLRAIPGLFNYPSLEQVILLNNPIAEVNGSQYFDRSTGRYHTMPNLKEMMLTGSGITAISDDLVFVFKKRGARAVLIFPSVEDPTTHTWAEKKVSFTIDLKNIQRARASRSLGLVPRPTAAVTQASPAILSTEPAGDSPVQLSRAVVPVQPRVRPSGVAVPPSAGDTANQPREGVFEETINLETGGTQGGGGRLVRRIHRAIGTLTRRFRR